MADKLITMGIQQLIITAPYGSVEIMLDDQQVHQIRSLPLSEPIRVNTDFAIEVEAALQDYFIDRNKPLTFSILQQGSEFQYRVWQYLTMIPNGETQSYGEVAEALDTGARAVANACRRNPTPIIVPCHRVVAANGLGGYAGKIEGFEVGVKEWLLAHESN